MDKEVPEFFSSTKVALISRIKRTNYTNKTFVSFEKKEVGKMPRKNEKGPGANPDELNYFMLRKATRFVGRNGVTWNGRHYYNDALFGIRDKVIVRYSPICNEILYIFTLKNQFLCMAKPIEKTSSDIWITWMKKCFPKEMTKHELKSRKSGKRPEVSRR
jgi:hypothetical protein